MGKIICLPTLYLFKCVGFSHKITVNGFNLLTWEYQSYWRMLNIVFNYKMSWHIAGKIFHKIWISLWLWKVFPLEYMFPYDNISLFFYFLQVTWTSPMSYHSIIEITLWLDVCISAEPFLAFSTKVNSSCDNVIVSSHDELNF